MASSPGSGDESSVPRAQDAGRIGDALSDAVDVWRDLRFLLGDWEGEGSGAPGEGRGRVRFTLELDGRALVRRSHTEYPAVGERPASTFDEMTVLSEEPEGIHASFFDSEGHAIRYRVEATPEGCVWTSEAPAGPRFRFTYRRVGEDRLHARFEIAPPGGEYATYVEGWSRRAPRPATG